MDSWSGIGSICGMQSVNDGDRNALRAVWIRERADHCESDIGAARTSACSASARSNTLSV